MPPSTREVLSELERRQFEALREVARRVIGSPRTPPALGEALSTSIHHLEGLLIVREEALHALAQVEKVLAGHANWLEGLTAWHAQACHQLEGMIALYRITLESLPTINSWTYPPDAFPWQVEAGRILLSRHNAKLLGWSRSDRSHRAWIAHVAPSDGARFTDTKLWRRLWDQNFRHPILVIPWDGPEPDGDRDPEDPARLLYLMLEAGREPEWE